MDIFDLKGRKVLITGSSRGIGFAAAKLLHELGATVLFSGTNQDKLDEIVGQFSTRALALAFDLSQMDKIDGFCKKAIEMLDGLDVLVCNAGIVKRGLAMKLSEKDWDDVININLKACFLLNQKIVRYMMKNNSGSVINISSVLGFKNIPGSVNYSTAKAGLVAMTRTFATEFAARNIRFNCVAPGYITTDMTSTIQPELREKILQETPMGSFGKADDIAKAIAFLASNSMSGYITGQTIHVNGGMFMT